MPIKKTAPTNTDNVSADTSVSTKPYKPNKSWKLKLGLGLLVLTLLVSAGVAYYFIKPSSDEQVAPQLVLIPR